MKRYRICLFVLASIAMVYLTAWTHDHWAFYPNLVVAMLLFFVAVMDFTL